MNQRSRSSHGAIGNLTIVTTITSIVAMGVVAAGVGMRVGSGRDHRDLSSAFVSLLLGVGLVVSAIAAWFAVQAWFFLAQVAHFAVYREREWLADATAAKITRRPEALASALEKA